MVSNVSAFKRSLLKVFDSVYKEVFQLGVKRLTIDIVENKILIVGDHARLPGLAALDFSNRFVTRMADVALLDECKARLTRALAEQFPEVRVLSVLNDYDPATEIAVTVIVTEEKIAAAS